MISITQESIRKVEPQLTFRLAASDSVVIHGHVAVWGSWAWRTLIRVRWKTRVLVPMPSPPYVAPLSPVAPGEMRSWFLPRLSLGQLRKNSKSYTGSHCGHGEPLCKCKGKLQVRIFTFHPQPSQGNPLFVSYIITRVNIHLSPSIMLQ